MEEQKTNKIQDRIGEPATPEAIKAFEEGYGMSLPSDYRGFLQSQNGGRPEKISRVFTFQKEYGWTSDSLIDWFSGLSDGEAYSLEEGLDISEDLIPEGMLPIACDPFGNLILLGDGLQSNLGVWFWGHEIAPTEINKAGIFKVAPSFDKFIENLEALPE